MKSRLIYEALSAAIWGTPTVLILLATMFSTTGQPASKANAPDLGASQPVQVAVPKTISQPFPQEPATVAQGTSQGDAFKRGNMPTSRNVVEAQMKPTEELSTSERDATINQYRSAKIEGKYDLEILPENGFSIQQLGDQFFVRADNNAVVFDRTGYARQPSRTQEGGLCVRVSEHQIPPRVMESIRSEKWIHRSSNVQYKLVLSTAIEIELYRSLYAFMEQQNLKAPISGHQYQAHLTLHPGGPDAARPSVVWKSLGQSLSQGYPNREFNFARYSDR